MKRAIATPIKKRVVALPVYQMHRFVWDTDGCQVYKDVTLRPHAAEVDVDGAVLDLALFWDVDPQVIYRDVMLFCAALDKGRIEYTIDA